MKKLALLLLFVFALNACTSLDDNSPIYHLEVLPVESFTVPDSFNMNAEYEIKVTYKRPTNCYAYDGIYYEKHDFTRVFGVQAKVLDSNECIPIDEAAIETTFRFLCTPGYKKYVFKFYKGDDENGNNIFEEVEVPVTY